MNLNMTEWDARGARGAYSAFLNDLESPTCTVERQVNTWGKPYQDREVKWSPTHYQAYLREWHALFYSPPPNN